MICIDGDDLDIEHLFQGYLCYPEEYPDFYKSKDFILCYWHQKNLDFEELLNSEINLKNIRFIDWLKAK